MQRISVAFLNGNILLLLFMFILLCTGQKQSENGNTERRTSRFYLVDLAGSERQKRTESSGLRLKEANCINKSLSALGNVIKSLVDNSEGKSCHIPYRDSKLTYLLKDALGGNSKCALIANISPAAINVDETLSTLKFAQRAKLMHNLAVPNEDDNPGSITEELKCLRLEVTALRAKLGRVLLNDHRRSPIFHEHGGIMPYADQGRIRRIEAILTQFSKDALVSEKRSMDEMHALSLKVEATKSLCQKLDKLLQMYNLQQSLDRCLPDKINKNIVQRSQKFLTKAEVMSQLQQVLDRCLPKKFKGNSVRRSQKSSLTAITHEE